MLTRFPACLLMSDSVPGSEPLLDACSACQQVIDVSEIRPFDEIVCPICGQTVRVRTQFGKFQLLEEIGEGGMARVFKARDTTLDRDVALKILHHHYSDRPDLLSKFEQEARVTASINHPNVVQVYSVGRDHGYFFIAMELLDSRNLDFQIARRGKLDQITALRLLHEVTQGLAAAFQAGLIHRDVKPGNILLDANGTAKIVDFGLAIMHDAEQDAMAEIWATPFYVPPEKLRRAPDTFKGDFYSLGATFFHALSGAPPHAANTFSIEELIALKAKPAQLSASALHLSGATVSLIHKLMAPKPDSRFASHDELLHAIAQLRQRVDPDFVVPTRRKKIPKWATITIGTAATVALLGGTIVLLKPEPPGPDEDGPDVAERPVTSLRPGSREITVSARDTAHRRILEEARQLVVDGERDAARRRFRELFGGPDVSPAVQAWCAYHLGLEDLLAGTQETAIRHFENAARLAGQAKSPEARAFRTLLKEIRSVTGVSESAVSGPLAPLGPLTLGFERWSRGRLEAAETHLKAFLGQETTPETEWIVGYAGAARDRLDDLEKLVLLPNFSKAEIQALPPRRLLQIRNRLNDASGQLITAEALRTVEDRLAMLEPYLDQARSSLTDEQMAKDRSLIVDTADQLRPLLEKQDFDSGIRAWRALELQTSEGKRFAERQAEAWESARNFPRQLSAELEGLSYEGQILREDARPFSAQILRGTETQIFVDIGFGATPVKLDSISAEGFLTIARATLPRAGSAELRAAGACFAWLMGDVEFAGELAALATGVPGFEERWQALTRLP